VLQGIGVDILHSDRFSGLTEKDDFLQQVFTKNEIVQGKTLARPQSLWAMMFALKEAIFKAFHIGLFSGSFWHDIDILDRNTVALSGTLKKNTTRTSRIFCDMTFSRHYVVSIALVQS